jgi:hypothetical protein
LIGRRAGRGGGKKREEEGRRVPIRVMWTHYLGLEYSGVLIPSAVKDHDMKS